MNGGFHNEKLQINMQLLHITLTQFSTVKICRELMRKQNTKQKKPINTDLFNRATVAQDVSSTIIHPIAIVMVVIMRMVAVAVQAAAVAVAGTTAAHAIIGVHHHQLKRAHAVETTTKLRQIVLEIDPVNIRSGLTY